MPLFGEEDTGDLDEPYDWDRATEIAPGIYYYPDDPSESADDNGADTNLSPDDMFGYDEPEDQRDYDADSASVQPSGIAANRPDTGNNTILPGWSVMPMRDLEYFGKKFVGNLVGTVAKDTVKYGLPAAVSYALTQQGLQSPKFIAGKIVGGALYAAIINVIWAATSAGVDVYEEGMGESWVNGYVDGYFHADTFVDNWTPADKPFYTNNYERWHYANSLFLF